MTRQWQPREIKDSEKPISERYRLIAKQWADADGAASLLEAMKSTTLELRKSALIGKAIWRTTRRNATLSRAHLNDRDGSKVTISG
jgi:hypothetical protein